MFPDTMILISFRKADYFIKEFLHTDEPNVEVCFHSFVYKFMKSFLL
jgi:hypothetical protein